MKLDSLTEEEIRNVIYKILCKIETDKAIVEKVMKYSPIVKTNAGYCFEYYNGFEHKLCCISDRKVYVSSEGEQDNKHLTNYLKTVLHEVAEEKYSHQI